LGPVAGRNEPALGRVLEQQTKEEWRVMALASGWSPEFQEKKSLEAAFGSLFIDLIKSVQ